MLKLDALLMRADISCLEAERPDLDHTIVRGLYENFVDCHGRQPDLYEFRDYVDRITSSIDWLDLHNHSSNRPTGGALTATLTATAVTLGATGWRRWTDDRACRLRRVP